MLPHQGIAPSSIDDARAAALAQLPPDAQVLWFKTRSTCAHEELLSPTLGPLLTGAGDPTGYVYVEITTETATSVGYDPTNANELSFSAETYPTATGAPVCSV